MLAGGVRVFSDCALRCLCVEGGGDLELPVARSESHPRHGFALRLLDSCQPHPSSQVVAMLSGVDTSWWVSWRG